ncbi:imidazole glycerol phosphate synthase subunit HisH [Leptospira kmetyi]|uniref:Imidazole glycerol phosphate synthase subunit HisH n=1 Tax=Leptospira kmetyi TaxID=408139 RepID=A0A5F1XY72_9LEPT|nr:imidazole glycerol phosphate synthase subunit HisH [Leptospira kmetyi]AYV57215.1 imidazole glycerol phosphate synthase subunit HisH [Leptospira kmetyi]TGK21422.1 imidazole glycerol phosphate synthase subunit HisH [Leptospira kmetyi]TGK28349.1 imidazole glycerol phosphate synthase subunit HisH [Leptospira kmetyi]TGL68284.1 imidazole glycerol phosphate synthase subunit HisH [Leptospira kmetyi]
MKSVDVTVIDYGIGNLLSVLRAFEHCNARVEVTSNPSDILSSPRVVLPGVGAFADGMQGLKNQELDQVALEVARRGTPLLGICLGMQMLLDESEEFGLTSGLGLIPGRVVPIPTTTFDGKIQKIPHIGWNELEFSNGVEKSPNSILKTVEPRQSVYFVHSFMALPVDPNNIISYCLYGGRPVAAVIQKDNVYGCQFHPEKSGEVGMSILKGFLAL